MAGSSNNAPEFFTVFLPEFCSHQLKITSSFETHLEKEVTGEAIIERSATNKVWKVDLVKEGEDFLFKKGWKEFVSENGVTIGEFMVFQYHGNSRFTVAIFGTDGLEKLKLAPGKQTVILLEEDGKGDTDDEDCDNLGGATKAVGRMKIGKSGKGCMSPKGNKGAKKLREKESTNPSSFRVRMTKSYVANSSMHLPRAFSNRYMSKNDVQRVEIGTSKKTWSVDVLSYKEDYYMFRGEGFGDFLRHNRIQAGDVCVFEALDLPCTTLSVSFLRTRGD